MAKKFHIPTRMCISCRKKDAQKNFTRLQCKDKEIVSYTKIGRSFYICKECINNQKKLVKSLQRVCKTNQKEKLLEKLKEIIVNE